MVDEYIVLGGSLAGTRYHRGGGVGGAVDWNVASVGDDTAADGGGGAGCGEGTDGGDAAGGDVASADGGGTDSPPLWKMT